MRVRFDGEWQTRGAAHLIRHRIPEQLEALVEACLELGDEGRNAVEALRPFVQQYGVRLRLELGGPGRVALDVHDLYTLRAEVQTALAIVMGAARALDDAALVQTCRQLQQQLGLGMRPAVAATSA